MTKIKPWKPRPNFIRDFQRTSELSLTTGVEEALGVAEKLGDHYNVTNLENLQNQLDQIMFCDLKTNPCFSNKCSHGACKSMFEKNEYECDCEKPYSGEYCTEAPNFCKGNQVSVKNSLYRL